MKKNLANLTVTIDREVLERFRKERNWFRISKWVENCMLEELKVVDSWKEGKKDTLN